MVAYLTVQRGDRLQLPKQWSEWEPGEAVLTTDLALGKSESQILAMGRRAWSKYRGGGADLGDVVFSICLYHRNERVLAKLSKTRRSQIITVKTAAWQSAMACNALEHVEEGGGTAAVHNRRYIRLEVEQLTYELATEGRHRSLRMAPSQLERRIRDAMLKRQKATYWPPSGPFTPSLSELHRFGSQAVSGFNAALLRSHRFSRDKAVRVLYFLDKWSIGDHEVGVLGADRY